MSSYIAAVKGLIKAGNVVPAIQGYGPTPVPSTATFPYVTLREGLSRDMETLEGRNGITRSIIHVNSWSKDYDEAHAMRKAIKTLLLPFSGPVAGLYVQGMNHHGDHEVYDDQRELHQLVASFAILWGQPS